MITDEQVKEAVNAWANARALNRFSTNPEFSFDAEAMRKALEAYEQSKWVKIDVDDESTYPQKTGFYVAFDGRYESYKYWDRAIGGDKRSINQSWFVSESVNSKKVTHWQPLPIFKE